MKNKVIVGYQGIKYCNNYYAVLDIVEQFKQVHPDTEVEIIPLEHSDKVIAALKKKEIDYGTMAFGSWDQGQRDRRCVKRCEV